jgi:hypothetical protein
MAFDIANLAKALEEGGGGAGIFLGQSAIEKPDHWQGRLLRARRERPCRRAAEKRYELAP